MNSQSLIRHLQLEPHPEGGYFRRTYEATRVNQGRRWMSSIYYLLTRDSPTGHLHSNHSDIVHYWQLGSPVRYTLLDPNRPERLLHYTLGPDLEHGHQLQLTVPGGFWKASELTGGEFGLISEAVCPGFDYDDHSMAEPDTLRQKYPQHWPELGRLCSGNHR